MPDKKIVFDNNAFENAMRNEIYKIPASDYGKYVQGLSIDPFAKSIWARMHGSEFNYLSIFVGEVGVGKSISATSHCEQIDVSQIGVPRFFNYCSSEGIPHPLSRTVYDFDAVLRLLTQVNLPYGSMILWDETGVEADATRFFTYKARVLKYILQTFRFKRLGVVLTCPDLESIMIGARRLLHYCIDVQHKVEGKYTECEAWRFRRDRVHKKDLYPMHPRLYNRPEKELIIMDEYKLYKPLHPLLEKYYDRIKKRITDNWYSNYDEQISKMKEFTKAHHISDLETLLDDELKADVSKKIPLVELFDYLKANKDLFVNKRGSYDIALASIDLQRKKKNYKTEELRYVVRALNQEKTQ